MQYPSERVYSGRTARVRSRTRLVQRCNGCNATFDVQPREVIFDVNPETLTQYETRGGPKCPECGGEYFRESRIKD